MLQIISNTSPFLFLYRIGVIQWLPELFQTIWLPQAVIDELKLAEEKDTIFLSYPPTPG